MSTRPSTPWRKASGVACELCESTLVVDELKQCVFCGWMAPLDGRKRSSKRHSSTPSTSKANKRIKSRHHVADSEDLQDSEDLERSVRQSDFCHRLCSCDNDVKVSEGDRRLFDPNIWGAGGASLEDVEICDMVVGDMDYFDKYFKNEVFMSHPVCDFDVVDNMISLQPIAKGFFEEELTQEILDTFS